MQIPKGFAVLVALLVGPLLAPVASAVAAAQEITIYKSPWCGCCSAWANHLRDKGFSIVIRDTEDVEAVRSEKRVPPALASCHTAVVAGYVVEGHVPAAEIARLINQRPKILGLAVPGMPAGAPGMESAGREAFTVLAIQDGGKEYVFARY